MDFKVAGTSDYITALQLDTKLDGIPSEVLANALQQARNAREEILDIMAEGIDGPDEMSPQAPKITSIKIPVSKIGELIGLRARPSTPSPKKPALTFPSKMTVLFTFLLPPVKRLTRQLRRSTLSRTLSCRRSASVSWAPL